jgi:hypothetical protein
MSEPVGTAIDNKYQIRLENKSSFPYALINDYLLSTVSVYYKNRLVYIKDLAVELWFNANGGVWVKQSDNTTDRRGICFTQTSSNFVMSSITNCLGKAVVTIDGLTYASNLIRYNFYQGAVYFELIIDAHTYDTDRSAFDIFDGSGRIIIYDRMQT